MMKTIVSVFVACLLLSGAAFAGINYDEPASLLIYPFFSSDVGEDTIISVTNVNRNMIYNQNTDRLLGEVVAHFFYVDADDCDITNRKEYLTPGDLLTVLVSQHNPAMNKGFLLIIAEDPNFLVPIKWDGIQVVIPQVLEYTSGLIGDCIVANGVLNFLWAIPAIGIKACGEANVGDPLDFLDSLAYGVEYEGLPTELFVSSFVEQGPKFFNAESYLVLLDPTVAGSTIDLLYLFYNNDEVEFSQTDSFSCWMMETLDDIFNGADNLQGVNAIVPTGWIAIQTREDRPVPLLGMIIQSLVNEDYSSARLLHHFGDTAYGEIDL